MSALDAFLDLCDADPDFDSGEEDDPFERLCNNSGRDQRKPESVAVDNKKEFQDLFGSPVKIATGQTPKTPALESKLTPTPPLPRTPFSINQFGKNQSVKSPFNSAQDGLVRDPYSGLRLSKKSIQLYFDEVQTVDLSMKERNLTVPYTSLDKISSNKDKGHFWTCGVLVKKVPGVRQSAKGNDYVLWEISDLDSANPITLFLFGASASADSLKIIPVGTLLDLTNPSIMPENKPSGVGAPMFKLSVSLASQIRHIGMAHDFGFCGSKRKDGKSCMNPVNKLKCEVCVHHASAELRKLNAATKKGNKWAKQKGFTDYEKIQFAMRMESIRASSSEDVMTTNFGNKKSLPSSIGSPKTSASSMLATGSGARNSSGMADRIQTKVIPKPRMELQDASSSLQKKSKHSNITYSRDSSDLLRSVSNDDTSTKKKMELNLTPAQTKHLSDRDRFIIEKLEKSKPNSNLAAMLTDPNPGSQNFLKYLSDKQKKDDAGEKEKTPAGPGKVFMTREALMNMQKAVSVVKKCGPIQKTDPNAVSKKRKLPSIELEVVEPSSNMLNNKLLNSSSANAGKILQKSRPSGSNSNANGVQGTEMDSEEFQKILNAKSAHSDIAEDNQETDYFNKLERKEAIENKLLSTFSLATTAFMCRECKYVALSQSDLCKERNHPVRAVKAVKRFFKCKDCGNRTMSLDRLPKKPCTNCKSSAWLAAPVGKERSGPTLDSERLSIRGDEEKFLGSTSAKLFL